MEEFRIIEGFENYQISNYGNVKSLKFNKEKILKPRLDQNGYLYVGLRNNNKKSSKRIHKLIAITFLNHIPCGMELVVNHKDFNKQNNHVDNLEIISQRDNANKKHLETSSKYIGVSWKKRQSIWTAQITINGKLKYLGCFKNELDASNAYQNELFLLT